MPPEKHNSTMNRAAAGLISSLVDVALSQDVLFRQPQQLKCMYHGLTFTLLCVPYVFFLYHVGVDLWHARVMASVL